MKASDVMGRYDVIALAIVADRDAHLGRLVAELTRKADRLLRRQSLSDLLLGSGLAALEDEARRKSEALRRLCAVRRCRLTAAFYKAMLSPEVA